MGALPSGSFQHSMGGYLPQFNGRLITWVCLLFYGAYLLYERLSKAPEYALDEQLVTESDIYALGCLLYAVHSKGNPPFKNHGSLGSLRDNSTKPLPGLERMDSDLQGNVNLVQI